jgi:adenylate cyclase
MTRGLRAPRPAGLVSYRTSLVVAIPLLVFLTGAPIALMAYVTTRASIRTLAEALFAQVADQTAERAEAHLAQAPPAVDLLVTMYAEEANSPAADDLARRLLAAVRANPSFAWATFSAPDGSFVGVHRTPARSLVVNEGHLDAGKTKMTERTVVSDDEWVPLRKSDDFGYDPRTRPFYERATAAKKRVWIEPYVFFDEGVPGITCAAPVYAKDGSLRGVFTIDFDLNILSEFAAQVRTSAHGLVFIYTESGSLLAHPTLRVVTQTGNGGSGALVTKDNVPDPVVRAYFAASGSSGFELGGAPYLSATRAFEPDKGLSWRVGAVAPESDFTGGVERTARLALLASFVAMIVAVGASALLAGGIAAPLAHLSLEMDKVGGFELSGADPPPSMFREIATMNRALATMKSGLRSFASYVPRDVVRAMLASGQPAVLGGKTKTLTVFFSDLAGFTSFSEKMRPAELVDLLSVYFDEMTAIIGQHGGTVDKFIGDAIMAFWSAPGDDPEHAAHACEAALACARRLDELKAGDPKLALLSARIGVATGEVLVGNIGSHARLNYTVMGDTANLASRLEGLNKAYGSVILVSERTAEAARRHVVLRVVDVVAVKGKAHGVRVYEPIGLLGDESAEERARLAGAALDAYLARRWDEATASYAKMIELAPGDLAAATMKQRAEAYANDPPPEGWDGVLVMKEK